MRSFLFAIAGLAILAAPAAAQDSRVFASINFGYQAQNQDFRQAAEFPLYDETGNWDARHDLEGQRFFDLGGGYQVTRSLGVGIVYANRAKHTRDALISANVPSPVFTDTFRTATATVTGLTHSEQAVHLQALWTIPVTVEFDVTLFGGPTIFTARDVLVEGVVPTERGGDFTGVDVAAGTSSQRNTTMGVHLGVDTRYMFTKNVGAGGLLRFSRGSVTLTDPSAAGGDVSVDTGGLEIVAGLRFRF